MKWLLFIFYFQLLSADYGGGFAGSGFRYGSNAKELSLAGAVVSDKNQRFYAFSNPALLKYVRNSQLGFSYHSMSLDRSIQSFCYVKKLPPTAGVGISILRSGTKNIQGKNSMNEKTEVFSSQDIQGIISFGVSFGSRVAIGLNIKAFFSSIAPEILNEQSGTGIGLDFGISYKINRYLLFGGLIENFSGAYNWKFTKGSDQDNYNELLPKIIKLGITYNSYNNLLIYFQEDIFIVSGEYINYRPRLGIEYNLSNSVKFRGGIKQA